MSVFRIDSPARDGMCRPLGHYPPDSGKIKLPSSAPRRYSPFARPSANDRSVRTAVVHRLVFARLTFPSSSHLGGGFTREIAAFGLAAMCPTTTLIRSV